MCDDRASATTIPTIEYIVQPMEFKLTAKVRQALDSRYSVPIILLVVLLGQWFILFSSAGPAWDGIYYYSYARSIVFDGDMHIGNDLRLSYATAPIDFANAAPDQLLTATGRTASPFALGSALVWVPWLAILRGLAGLGQLAGLLPDSLTGYEWYFTLGLATLSMILGWLAFWLAYRLALQVSQKGSALLATLTLLFTTPLLFYMYADSLFAHATAAFITALYITVWWRYFRLPRTYAAALAMGALLGLASLVRWQHVVYGVLPLSAIVGWWLSLPDTERRGQIGRAVSLALLLALGAAAVLSLQLIHWRLLYGQWLTIPQGNEFMNWAAPYWRQVLFSSFKGLMTWMPVFFLALAGLLIQLKKRRQFLLPLLIVLLLETYINSSSADWFGGGGYGPRRFTGEAAILVVGYAGLLQWLPGRIRLLAGGLLGLGLALHQWLLLRFGLADELGGRVLSMVPDYKWAEVDFATFLQQIGSRLGDAAQRPGQLFNRPDTPLGMLRDGQFPVRPVAALAATAFFLGLGWLVATRLAGRRAPVWAWRGWLLLALLGLLILGADVWLLFMA